MAFNSIFDSIRARTFFNIIIVKYVSERESISDNASEEERLFKRKIFENIDGFVINDEETNKIYEDKNFLERCWKNYTENRDHFSENDYKAVIDYTLDEITGEIEGWT